jgi:hypothetical protein
MVSYPDNYREEARDRKLVTFDQSLISNNGDAKPGEMPGFDVW